VAECKPRVVLLSRGRIIADGPAAQILTNERVVQQASLVMPQIASLMKNLRDLNPPPNIIDAYSAGGFLSGKMKEKLAARIPNQRR